MPLPGYATPNRYGGICSRLSWLTLGPLNFKARRAWAQQAQLSNGPQSPCASFPPLEVPTGIAKYSKLSSEGQESAPPPPLAEFKAFLAQGGANLGLKDDFDVNTLGKNSDLPKIYTAVQIAKFKSKKAEVDSESVFESKLSSPPNTPTSQKSNHSFRDRSSSPSNGRGGDGKSPTAAASARPITPKADQKASSSSPKATSPRLKTPSKTSPKLPQSKAPSKPTESSKVVSLSQN
ncbi:hypothetical protein QBC36DRAFT_312619 [Triangularia setosa]|uniref:Uncharacterized protein n=1 Tax=Triangularia setosa TaxID=2587417 RepID=A0AAN7A671_9PEZI|nr:hypothetical protein QBC36DRAFT_312619 [Podospora setosa]